jgi:hypothetical protein
VPPVSRNKRLIICASFTISLFPKKFKWQLDQKLQYSTCFGSRFGFTNTRRICSKCQKMLHFFHTTILTMCTA